MLGIAVFWCTGSVTQPWTAFLLYWTVRVLFLMYKIYILQRIYVACECTTFLVCTLILWLIFSERSNVFTKSSCVAFVSTGSFVFVVMNSLVRTCSNFQPTYDVV
jgi:cytosine/uracil/thiamine/allantoin permease